MDNAVQTIDNEADNSPITPMGMLQMAIDKGADVDQLTKLMDLQERWEARRAKLAFDEALAAFQAEAPIIKKSSKAHNNTYAKLPDILREIQPLMKRHGLSHSWRTGQADNVVTVTCKLTHSAGHSEETTLSAAPDNSGSKNSIQAIGSTNTYLQRYTLNAVLGLASDDDDGNGAGGSPYIDQDRKEEILGLIKETGTDTKTMLQALFNGDVNSIDEITVRDCGRVLNALKAKKKKMESGNAGA